METQNFNKELLDYLYGEMSSDDRAAFEKKLKENHSLRAELDELSEVRAELENLKDKEVMEPFSTWGKVKSSAWFSAMRTRKVIVFRPVTAIAASLVILFMIGYLTNFSLSVTNQGFQLGFGEQIAQNVQPYFTEDEVKTIVSQELRKNNEMILAKLNNQEQSYNAKLTSLESELHDSKNSQDEISKQDLKDFFTSVENKNAETVKEYLKLTSTQQQEYFTAMLTQFNNFYQKQRDDDLTFIQASLYEINQNQAVQKQETDKAIASLYTTVSKKGD